MSETANWFSGASSADGIGDGRVGEPWGGRAGIVGADGIISAEGEGEIVVQTPALMSAYLDRQELTEAAIRDGWFRTGDTGRIDRRGEIILTGRIKEEINRGGIKVQPADVDRVLGAHPDVAEACAFALPDPASGEMVGVAVRMAEGKVMDALALRAWCMDRLRREAVPERFFAVGTMVVSGRGKVSRDAVRRAVTGDT
jgi:acyl-CoA synthetase (AMP-forming)/AMP-acid ligase II